MTNCPIEEFIERYEPAGKAGINSEHAWAYSRDDPFFFASTKFLPLGQNETRTWFVSYEANYYLNLALTDDVQVRESEQGTNCISKGKFLHFGKALFNVLCFMRGHRRTLPRDGITALTILEKGLRVTHSNSDPLLIDRQTFATAESLLENSRYSQQKKFDIGKELEIIAGMLQGGHSSKSFRHPAGGFNLLSSRFSFRSSMIAPPRLSALRLAQQNDIKARPAALMPDEVVACLGLAYQEAFRNEDCGELVRFVAASTALGFCAASMRSVELTLLRRDCVYRNDQGQSRLRISRLKIDEDQDLKISQILVELVDEALARIHSITAEAHQALSHYVSQADKPGRVESLYVPERLRKIFDRPFITFEQTRIALNLHDANNPEQIPSVLRGILIHKFVLQPGDLSPLSTDYAGQPTLILSEALALCANAGIIVNCPSDADNRRRITPGGLARMIGKLSKSRRSLLQSFFDCGPRVQAWFKTTDVLDHLLNDFKSSPFPHWPFATKERDLKLSDALMVMFQSANSKFKAPTEKQLLWWKPMLFTPSMMRRWLGGVGETPALLFGSLDIRLPDGNFPAYSIEDARKWHQTKGLLAGVPRIFLDQISGRNSGPQSDFYDYRSRLEKMNAMVETLRTIKEARVVGPTATIAISRIPIVMQQDFLFRTSSPKHLTELGGCKSDWSINPCEHLGDCLRCGGHIWIKGEHEKLKRIEGIKSLSEEIIAVGEKKAFLNPRRVTIAKQIAHAKEALKRCEEIIAVEADPLIPERAVVTFSRSETSSSIGERSAYIRAQD